MKDETIDSKRLEELISQGVKSPFFESLASDVIGLCDGLGLQDCQRTLTYLEQLWLPTALDLVTARQKLDRTLIQGILGGQGTGKSTLCMILKLILNQLGYSVACISIDDLYLTYAERQKLQQQDQRLIWRGPPGTHDVTLGLKVIEQCLQADNNTQILLPRFDKSAYNGSGDRIKKEKLEKISKPDILLFEGWFVGVRPITKDCFTNLPAHLNTLEAQQFAFDNNQRLHAYIPLWDKLDRLIVLLPEDYRLSKQWRKEAEQKMIAAGKTGMSDEEIDRFVEYFWQALHPELFIQPLISNADLVNLVVKIKSDRTLGRIYQPGNKK
jgi:D-glycerate 3-kinase